MNYTEVLNQTMEKLHMEAQAESYMPYAEAVEKLGLEQNEQILLCALWGLESMNGAGVSMGEFSAFYQEITGEEAVNLRE